MLKNFTLFLFIEYCNRINKIIKKSMLPIPIYIYNKMKHVSTNPCIVLLMLY